MDNYKPKNVSSKPSSNKIQSRSNFTGQNNRTNIYLLIPLILIICIQPFIVKSHIYNPNLSRYSWFSNTDYFIDFFLYYKQWFFTIICGIMLFIIIFKGFIDNKILRFTTLFIPLGIYALLALLSTIFSEYSSFGYSGVYEQFESIFAILGYCLVVYYAYIVVNSEHDVKLLLKLLFISIIVISLLGITQAIGIDFFKTNIGKKLILSKEFWSNADEMNFNMGKNRVYLTLFNPNYVGTYVSIIAPMILTLLLFKRNLKVIIFYLLMLIGLFICLFGSQSTTALIGIFISLIFIIFFLRRQIFNKWKLVLPILIVFILSLFIFNNSNNNILFSKFNSILNNKKVVSRLTNIKTNDDNISVEYNNNILNITFLTSNGQFSGFLFTDDKGQTVNSSSDANSLVFNIVDERFTGIQVEPYIYANYLSFRLKTSDNAWYFTNQTGDNSYYYINNSGKPDKIIQAESALFTGHESFASGRGYIWSRTIPLLKNNIILGSGADSFVFVFPHQDYLNQSNSGYANALINKPHNMYLQIGIQSGIISLIAIIAFYLIYFISCMRIYFKSDFNNYLSQVGVAIFIGTISYMICGFTNDSSITVAPVFWALVGIGISINRMVKLNYIK